MQKSEDKVKSVKPFLKWAGGKTQLLKELEQFVPSSYNTYIEAFLGGVLYFFIYAHLRQFYLI